MGILNVTPDSFSDGGKFNSADKSIAHVLSMINAGADIIDVGGESTRPRGLYGDGAKKISADEELSRVVPVIQKIRSLSDIPISIDTYKSAVAQEALQSGASIVNDISGLTFDPEVAVITAKYNAALVVMHIQGTPETMQDNPSYRDVVREVTVSLQASVAVGKSAGVEKIIVDPGIGFGKNLEHNLTLIKNLSALKTIGCPIMIGTSRKGFIGSILDLPVNDRLEGSAASVAVAIMNGANIIRVHDVKEMKRVSRVVDAIQNAA